MTLRDRLLGVAVGLTAALVASEAAACSYVNDYAADVVRSPAAAFADAATVDWVRIEPPPAPTCSRPPPTAGDDEDALDRAWEAYRAACAAADRPGGVGLVFTAQVVERLKGASPDRFTLVHRGWNGDWEQFSDLRAVAWEGHLSVALREKATADGRHSSDRFWLDGDLGPAADLMNSCGGWPTLDSRMRYLAFRDAGGAVIALEPVLYEDDELLARLRRARAEPDALTRRLPVADYFRTAQRMAAVRVSRCRHGDERVDARLLRGDPDGFPREEYRDVDGVSRPVRVKGIDVDFLHDWFVWTGTRCGGQTLLVVQHAGQGAPAADLDYAFEAVPEARATPLAEWFGQRGVDLSGRWLPRVVAVHDGKVRLSELSPEAALAGPAEITVDEAFAWFDEGRAARARR